MEYTTVTDIGAKPHGFTTVELIVTTIVVALFSGVFFQSYMLLENQRTSLVRQAKASDIAYNNLNKYPSRPSALQCPDANNPNGVTLGDSSSGAPGSYGFIKETDISPLKDATTRQVVTAYAPNGCDGNDFKSGIIKIVSTVTYGSDGRVDHVNFIQ